MPDHDEFVMHSKGYWTQAIAHEEALLRGLKVYEVRPYMRGTWCILVPRLSGSSEPTT